MRRLTNNLIGKIAVIFFTAVIFSASAIGQTEYLQGSNSPKFPRMVSSEGFLGYASVYPTKPVKTEYFSFRAGVNMTYTVDLATISSTSGNSLSVELLDAEGGTLNGVEQITLLPTKRESSAKQCKFFSDKQQNILVRVTFVLVDPEGNPREPAPSEEATRIDEETATSASIGYVSTTIKYRVKIVNNGLFREKINVPTIEPGYKTKPLKGVLRP